MPAAIAVWGGVLAGAALGVVPALAMVVAALAWSWLAARAPDRTGTVCLVVALALAGAARGAGHHARVAVARAALAAAVQPQWLEARLVTPPERASGEPQVVVAVERANAPLVRGSRLQLRLPEGTTLEWGDRTRLLVEAGAPGPVRNPGGFDPHAAAEAAALAGMGRAAAAGALATPWLLRWPSLSAMRARRAIERALATHLDTTACALAIPLVTGDRSLLPTEQAAEQRASGLVHLLALSGLQVAWLAALARAVCASLGGGPRARALTGAACAVFYVMLAGPVPSLLRTSASELLAALARLRGRALDPLQALALAALTLLLVAPGVAGDLGFQLSCAATLGLVVLSPTPERLPGWGRWLRWLAPSCAAQVAALPILVARMHALSWAGPFANLVAVPVSGLLLTAAWLAVLADWLVPGAGGLLFGACDVLGDTLRVWTSWMAHLPRALLPAGRDPAIAWCAALGVALLALGFGGGRTLAGRHAGPTRAAFVARLLGAACLGAALLEVLAVTPVRPPAGAVWVVTLDVGQGDATAIATGHAWWLVDAGPRTPHRDAGEAAVLPFLRWAGVRGLEGLVLTHDDGDHTGGAAAVRRGVHVVRVLAAPPLDAAPGPGARYHAGVAARGDVLEPAAPMIVQWPPREAPGWTPRTSLTSPDNAAGVVLELGRAGGRALLLADVDSLVEQRLCVAPGVAMLHVGHHGSASSSGETFLARLRPGLAVISVGARNRFGHPSPAVLARLARVGTPVRRTDRDGAVWVELTAAGARLLDWRRGEPRAERVAHPSVHGPSP